MKFKNYHEYSKSYIYYWSNKNSPKFNFMKLHFLPVAMVSIAMLSCKQEKTGSVQSANEAAAEIPQEQVVKHVMTKEQQAALTPDAVLKDLMDANMRFNSGKLMPRDHSAQARKSTGTISKSGYIELFRQPSSGRRCL